MKLNKKVWDWRTHIIHDAPDNPTYKHLLLTLSCYMDSAGKSCFPSLTTLEKTTSLSRPTIIKYLKKAKRDGWIHIEKSKDGNSRWKHNNYTASLPERVVKEVNHHRKQFNQGSKTDNEKGLNSLTRVVKEVNSNSPYTSSNNSPLSSGKNENLDNLKKMQQLFPTGSEIAK